MIDLSIIVPVYNVEDYLVECLESIYAINLINIEVILVNDGSTDESQKIIEIYKEKYKLKTKVINQKNKGLSGARNAGFKLASGKYTMFIDSDDFIDGKIIEKIFIRGKEEELDIMFFNFEYFGDNVNSDKIDLNISDKDLMNGLEFFEKIYDYKNNFINVEVCTNIFNSNFLKVNNLDFVEGLLHEDTLFMFKAMYFAERVQYFAKQPYKYRYRENSIMNSQTEKNYRHKLFIANELLDFKVAKKIDNNSWDNIIISLIFTANKKFNIKNNSLNKKIKSVKKLTIENKIKKFINIYIYRLKGENIKLEV